MCHASICSYIFISLCDIEKVGQFTPRQLCAVVLQSFMYMPTILDCNFGKHVAQKDDRGFAMLQACSLCCWEPVLQPECIATEMQQKCIATEGEVSYNAKGCAFVLAGDGPAPSDSQYGGSHVPTIVLPQQEQDLRPLLSRKQPSVTNWTPPALPSEQQEVEGNLLATTIAGHAAVPGVRLTPTHRLTYSFGHVLSQTELSGHSWAMLSALSSFVIAHATYSGLVSLPKAVIPCMQDVTACNRPNAVCMDE